MKLKLLALTTIILAPTLVQAAPTVPSLKALGMRAALQIPKTIRTRVRLPKELASDVNLLEDAITTILSIDPELTSEEEAWLAVKCAPLIAEPDYVPTTTPAQQQRATELLLALLRYMADTTRTEPTPPNIQTIALLLARMRPNLTVAGIRYELIHLAVLHADSSVITALLATLPPDQKAAAVTQQNQLGQSPLHRAARLGRADTVKALLAALSPEQQFDAIMQQDIYQETPVHLAVHNEPAIVRELFAVLTPAQKVAALMQNNVNGDTPLHLALETSRVEFLTELLTEIPVKQLAEIFRQRNLFDETPMELASTDRTRQFLEFFFGPPQE